MIRSKQKLRQSSIDFQKDGTPKKSKSSGTPKKSKSSGTPKKSKSIDVVKV